MKILTDYAQSFLGVPYKWGGETPMGGVDCSGFIKEILASTGITFTKDQVAQELYYMFSEGRGEAGSYVAGALAFYGESASKITHVAMLLDQYRVIEAGGGGAAVVDEKTAIASKAFVRIRLVTHRRDLVAVIRPYYWQIGVR